MSCLSWDILSAKIVYKSKYIKKIYNPFQHGKVHCIIYIIFTSTYKKIVRFHLLPTEIDCILQLLETDRDWNPRIQF